MQRRDGEMREEKGRNRNMKTRENLTTTKTDSKPLLHQMLSPSPPHHSVGAEIPRGAPTSGSRKASCSLLLWDAKQEECPHPKQKLAVPRSPLGAPTGLSRLLG